MKLSSFITDHLEDILIEWEAFAKTLQPSSGDMTSVELRDHGKQILEDISKEIDTGQSSKEQEEKSKGLAPVVANTDTAAGEHGTVRQEFGFSMPQLVAEYRAMRACVLRLWLPNLEKITDETSEDMLRFNEAIDQALAESSVTFSSQASQTRDTFLAILGHDLRSPLATMHMAGEYLTRQGVGTDDTTKIGARVKRSAATMTSMVNDLLEYARKQLGGKMPVARKLADMKEICQSALEDASASHPECEFDLVTSGDLLGDFDSVRLQQVFSNLLNNAAQYRGKGHGVSMTVQGEPDAVTVKVKNYGPVIRPESLKAIFDPLVQLSKDDEQKGGASTSMGLGLFVSREITEAHDGTIKVDSDENSGTVFTVKIPKWEEIR